MFATFKQIFNRKNKDLQKKILFTFAALFIFKLGTAIIVPGIDKNSLTGNLGFFELMNAMGGGAMEKFSIFALGVMPYITASIIIQLLSMDIIPYLTELSKQGISGRNKMNQITRIVGIIFAFVQGYIYSFTYVGAAAGSVSTMQYIEFAVVLTAGTSLLLWLGDQITAKGIGNGISLIIMAGIIANLPTMFISAWNTLIDLQASTQAISFGVVMFILFVLTYVAIILGIIYEETAERRIPIQYANKSSNSYGGQQNYIPFRLNSAGVIPVIFASAIISIPSIIAAFLKNEVMTSFINKWIVMTTPTGLILYVLCIFGFAYFYTFIQLKPEELADNLNKNGGFVPGVRPGEDTVSYISKIIKRITFVGALALAIFAAVPVVFGMFSSMPSSVTIGGTGLLIVVGVALETYKQIESQLISRTYTRGRKK
ncbi:MAG: preprotein translocase subunit SecY [Bacilli bacterium]